MNALKYWLLLVGLLAAGYASFVVWRADHPRVQAGGNLPAATTRTADDTAASRALAGPVAPFTLTDQNGQPFDSAELEGKVWVASFFFTNCPAVCWRMNQALAAWQQTHPKSDVRFVSITCDPDNDTPEALAKYAEHFKADPKRWTFLTGKMDQIKSIGQDSFKISVVEKDHTDRACVVDRQGQVRGRFRLTEADQVEMLDRLLGVVEAESAEPSTEADETAAKRGTQPTTEAQVPGELPAAERPASTSS